MKRITTLSFFMLFCWITAFAIPRAEYPRPQFERNAWINLNGEWTYSFDFGGSGLEREWFKSTGFDQKIIVPFCPESKLSGVEYKDFINHMWYHRTISIPQDWANKQVLLNFGAVYYKSEIYIDGVFAARHFGGTSSFQVDITPYVKAGQTHNLVVYVESDVRSTHQPSGKQNLQFASYGCNYTRTTGIWQTVWMEAVHPEGLQSVQMIPDIDQQQLIIRPRFYKELGGKLEVTLKDNGKVVSKETVAANSLSTVILPVKKMKTWSPENPFLYDVELRVIDKLHQKVFEERFYYWADKLGYLTWGEASSWGMDCNDIETARNFITEWTEIVERDRNHPSILIWTPTNEEFWPDRVQYPRLMQDLYKLTKAIDPTRPFHGTSGGSHIATDIWTVHNYEQDPAKLKELLYNDGKLMEAPKWEIQLMPKNIGYNGLKYTDQYTFPQYKHDMPYLIDEFGGIKWNPSQQMESAQNTSWGYGEPPHSLEEFYARLEGLVDTVLSLSDHVWGYCYTQLTDVEQEQNGIYYYDRSPKFDMKRIHAIFSKNPLIFLNRYKYQNLLEELYSPYYLLLL